MTSVAESTRALAGLIEDGMAAFDVPITVAELDVFETANGVEIPVSYARFITEVASGGPGPANGLLAFPWKLVDERLAGEWIDPLDDESETGSWDEGVLAVGDLGCGSLAMLVLTGPHRGEIWYDLTAGDDGYRRVAGSFAEWYGDWADTKVAALRQKANVDARECDERFAAACAAPANWERLRPALYTLGHHDDPRFAEALQLACDSGTLGVHAADTVVGYALRAGLGAVIETLLTKRIADGDDERPYFVGQRALVRAHLGRVDEAIADWTEAMQDNDFEPPRGSAARIVVELLRHDRSSDALQAFFYDGLPVAQVREAVELAVSAGLTDAACKWAALVVETVLSELDADDEGELDEEDWDGELAYAHMGLAIAQAHAGHIDEAVGSARRVEAHHGRVDWATLALLACEGGAYAEAMEFLERPVGARPWWTANLKGCCLQGLDRLDEALAAFEESLGHRRWIVPFENRAYVYIRQGELETATVILDAVEAFAPDFAYTHYHRATLLARLGDAAGARTSYERACALGIDLADARIDSLLAHVLGSDGGAERPA